MAEREKKSNKAIKIICVYICCTKMAVCCVYAETSLNESSCQGLSSKFVLMCYV